MYNFNSCIKINSIKVIRDIGMKNFLKKHAVLLIALATLVIFLAYAFYIYTRPRIIATSISPDGKYTLSFIETESPVFFGSSEVSILLEKPEKEKQEFNTTIANDGKYLDEENWKVTWEKDYVEVLLIGEEQGDEDLRFYFIDKLEK